METSTVHDSPQGLPPSPWLHARSASRWRPSIAWPIDQIVLVVAFIAGVGALAANVELSDGQAVFVLFGMSFAVPIMYGLLWRRGRTLGCLVAGTAFVRIDTQQRATWGGTARYVLLRWWLPVVGLLVVVSLFSLDTGGDGLDTAHESRRVR